MKFILTQETAIKHLGLLFPDSSRNTISVEEAYINGSRNLEEKEKNRTWLKNQLAYLKQHKFIKSQLDKNTTALVGIELTERGKIALGRIEGQLNLPMQETKQENKSEEKKQVQNGFAKNSQPKENIIPELIRAWKETPNSNLVYDSNSGTVSLKR